MIIKSKMINNLLLFLDVKSKLLQVGWMHHLRIQIEPPCIMQHKWMRRRCSDAVLPSYTRIHANIAKSFARNAVVYGPIGPIEGNNFHQNSNYTHFWSSLRRCDIFKWWTRSPDINLSNGSRLRYYLLTVKIVINWCKKA